jgi:beta-phosphoglucomutase-like phosphatase (HAD superfamily)
MWDAISRLHSTATSADEELVLSEHQVSIKQIKADPQVYLFDCSRVGAPGQAGTVLGITRAQIVELVCLQGDARAAIRDGSRAEVALCVPITSLESADEYNKDPTALQIKLSPTCSWSEIRSDGRVGLRFGGVRVYRMGAKKVAQALQLVHSRLLQQLTGRPGAALAPARARPASAPRTLMCALDFDQTITRRDHVKPAREPNLAALIGTPRIALMQEMCRQLVQSGVVLCVVSLNWKVAIQPVLKKLGLLELLDAVYDQPDVLRFQNKQNFMLHLMQQHGIQPQHCVLVDDQQNNLVGAPCKAVLVRDRGGIQAREVVEIFAALGLVAQTPQNGASALNGHAAGAGAVSTGHVYRANKNNHNNSSSSSSSNSNNNNNSSSRRSSSNTRSDAGPQPSYNAAARDTAACDTAAHAAAAAWMMSAERAHILKSFLCSACI